MRTLIVGLGSIGRRHLRNLKALGENDFVLLRSGRSTLPDEDLQGIPVVSDLRQALEAMPDAAVICTPTALHLETAIPAARAGLHLLIEKPISHSLEGTDVLQSLLKESGAGALVGFQFRFHPCLQQLAKLLQSGEIGDVVYAEATWGEYLPGWHPWEDHRLSYSARGDLGGGVLLTLCHPFDYLLWLVGPVCEVAASVASPGHLQLHDAEGVADVLARFKNGAQGSIHLDYVRRPPRHTLEIVGTRSVAVCDLLAGTLRWSNSDDNLWHEFAVPKGFERNDLFLAEMANFLAVVQAEEKPRCGVQEGLQSLKVVEAARKAALGGAWETV